MCFFSGQIIAFSGIDGAGKSTQIALLIQYLENSGLKPFYMWTRGGYTGPFNALKGVLRKCLGRRLPPSGRNTQREKAFQRRWVRYLWLFFAICDLILVYGIYFRLLRILGRIVVADRYLGDTWIDFRLNFPKVHVDRWFIWKLLIRVAPRPDVLFLLYIPVHESLRRSRLKNEPFPDSKEILEKRLGLYERIASRQDWQVLDCLQPIDSIHSDILEAVLKVSRHRP